jgi:putative integral membrane protein (TIGR02587 family)
MSRDKEYAKGLARAFAGAVLFAFPLTMTMEMWSLGFSMERDRLLLFVLINLFVLVGVSHFAGFERTIRWSDDVMDAFAAFGVGFIASLAMLAAFGIITFGMSAGEIAGKVALQAVPASIGALVSRNQLGEQEEEKEQEAELRKAGYAGQLFLMTVGALFLAFNVAPTDEMVLIAHKMSGWHALVLVVVSVVLLHTFVYAIGFSGQEVRPEGMSAGAAMLHFTIAGYGIAILVSLYALWTFGRTDGVSLAAVAQMVAVLGFPASLGAAVARLIV